LFPTNSVHQEATNNAAGEIKVVHYSAVTNILGKDIARIQLRDDCGREDRMPQNRSRTMEELPFVLASGSKQQH
jgi:hypothetical protein